LADGRRFLENSLHCVQVRSSPTLMAEYTSSIFTLATALLGRSPLSSGFTHFG
jgi:hypothetical protein